MRNAAWQDHEEHIAKTIPGAQKTVASGAKYEKCDVVRHDPVGDGYWGFLIECKSTAQVGFRVTRKLLEDTRQYTLERASDLREAQAIRLIGGKGEKTHDCVLLNLNDFAELLTEFDEMRAALLIEYGG